MTTPIIINPGDESSRKSRGSSGILLVLFIIAAVALAGFAFFQYKTITQKKAEIATLQEQNSNYASDQAKLNSYVEEVTQTVNEIGNRLRDVREKQVTYTTMLVTAKTDSTAKATILEDIARIESQLVADKKNLEDLQKKMKQSAIRIRALETMVAKLQKEIEDNQQTIASLAATISQKDQVIKTTQESLSMVQLNLLNTENKLRETEQTLEDTRNTAYYVIGKTKELKSKNIIDQQGFIRKKPSLSARFDKGQFTKVDVTKTPELTLACQAKDVVLVPPRDKGSYTLANLEKGKSALKIVDREEFWKVPYLVLVMD